MDWIAWVLEAAKSGGNALLTICLMGGIGVLWRQHVKDQRTQNSMWRSQQAMGKAQTRAQLATARNIATLAAKLDRLARR